MIIIKIIILNENFLNWIRGTNNNAIRFEKLNIYKSKYLGKISSKSLIFKRFMNFKIYKY